MKNERTVIPAKAGIQCWRDLKNWTPACAGETNPNITGPNQ
jgi:hypothetical protein